MHTEIIKKELKEQIKEGKGCIVFDFGCYFPYQNQDDLIFDFSIGLEKLSDKKRNHRYPNKGYVTLSRKIGRKVSKIGYPYFVDFEEKFILLCLWLGYKEDNIKLIFPLELSLSEDDPVCGLKLIFLFEKGEFTFTSYYPESDVGWNETLWTNKPIFGKDKNSYTLTLFREPDIEDNTLVCSEVIKPHACKLDNLLLV